jgi:hypothetical protein
VSRGKNNEFVIHRFRNNSEGLSSLSFLIFAIIRADPTGISLRAIGRGSSDVQKIFRVPGRFFVSLVGGAPAAPSFAAMPGPHKSYESFHDQYCQTSAQQAIGYQSPGQAANDAAVGSAVVGTALGALAGAALGSAAGHAGTGAAVGAGTGLVAGSAVGSGNAAAAVARYKRDTTPFMLSA